MVVIYLTTSKSQICRKTEMVLKKVPMTYQYTYEVVTREPSCWFIDCLKTETRIAKDVNMVDRYEAVDKYVCCEGYEGVDQDGNSTCQPRCSSNCQNGFCIKPETCACNEGYIHDPRNPNICLPLCVVTTNENYCQSPDSTPENACTLGYHENDTCHHLCSEPCLNGYCVTHDTCLCNPGFIKLDKFLCVSNCTDCECNKGWYYKDGDCKPVCEVSCGNGTCIAPNICNCSQGYEFSKDTKQCQPICDCVGVCIAPNVCSCETPFDVEVLGGKEVCFLTETTTIANETATDVTEENIATTQNTNALTLTEEKYNIKAVSVDHAVIPVHHERQIDNFFSKYWLYLLMTAITLVIVITLLICFIKRRGNISPEDKPEVSVIYQKNP
ncbi:hypothetical protein K1T71_005800 [Dendrolimus kikuchii]|uniref:Uncharacterized protein n=1 Tax=Dendrolimus kikuchii TaxID=765133 RepID=A0ACC1D579_9NEOP|nr:hypothetical protein K1T71_005800 [Dendrolimus kikuchii]